MKALRERSNLLAALLMLAALGPLHAEVLGPSHRGAVPSSGLTANFKRGSKVTLTELATATELCAYLDGNGGASGSQVVRMALYRDASGVPGAKIVETDEHPISANDITQLWCFEIPFTSLSPASYWVVLHSGSTANVGRYFYDSGTNWYGNDDAYDDGASKVFGSGSVRTGPMSVYLIYIPATRLSVAGHNTVGASPSRGLTPNFKRGSSLTMPTPGRISSLVAYLDGTGGEGPQAIRLALYTDANGVPGEKVVESDEKQLPPHLRPSWVSFDTPAVIVPQGKYWIVIHSGGTGGVLRDYTDAGTGNWFGNADEYSDGASNTFGAGRAENHTLSAYVTYAPGPFMLLPLGPGASFGSPSNGLTANFSRATRLQFFASNSTSLYGLHAYLDGQGGAAGSQDVRIVVYTEQNNGPGDLLLMSDVVTIQAGMGPQWVDFPMKPRLFESGAYWFAIQSGDTQGVVRDYAYDTSASWRGAPDVFANGPADPFGAEGSVSSQDVSLLVSGDLAIQITP